MFAEVKIYSAPYQRGDRKSAFNPTLNSTSGIINYDMDKYIDKKILPTLAK